MNRSSLIALMFALAGCAPGAVTPSESGSPSATGNPATATPTPPPMTVPPPTIPGASPTPVPTSSRQVSVTSISQLTSAIAAAQPGDVITISPGTYSITTKISANRSGTATNRITLKASSLGQVTLRTSTAEPIYLGGAYWTIENLVMEGVCASDDDCEHALHIVGNADGSIIRNNVLRDYNAQIKANGNGAGAYPDDVLIENNLFYDTRGRVTANPVTKIDVVGGRAWVIRGNFLGDFYKNGGNGISYAAFLKGNSSQGIMEGNVVACSKRHTGGTRIGLSLGGGGSAPDSICENGTCATEHRNGTIRDNVIMNCDDVGIYLNKAQNSTIDHNVLYQTAGVDVRFSTSTAVVRTNMMSGGIANRDGGVSTNTGNLVNVSNATFDSTFVAPAMGNFGSKSGSYTVKDAATLKAKYDSF